MSYRELRNFSETMRAIGYPFPISMDMFRSPNFYSMADILYWLVQRFEPNSELRPDINSEASRVEFIKSASKILNSSARISLNLHNLYMADGFAVRELIKPASLLNKAIRAEAEEDGKISFDVNLANKRDELRSARTLASEILESGTNLLTLLKEEENLITIRNKALNFLEQQALALESSSASIRKSSDSLIETNLQSKINELTDDISELTNQCKQLEKEKQDLTKRIVSKHDDLVRKDKKLKSLKSVRPAYMEEYERMEKELRDENEIYLERFRNLMYLESKLEKVRQQELERKEEQDRILARRQRKLREHDLALLRGDLVQKEGEEDDDVDDGVFGSEDEEEEEGDDDIGEIPNESDEEQDEEQDEEETDDDEYQQRGPPGSPINVNMERPGAPEQNFGKKFDNQVIGSMNPDDSEEESSGEEQESDF